LKSCDFLVQWRLFRLFICVNNTRNLADGSEIYVPVLNLSYVCVW